MPRSQLVSANAHLLSDGLDDVIMYIPEGTHDLECGLNGKPAKIKSSLPAEKGDAIAASFQKRL